MALSYIIAHRGASFDAPENTLAAFRLAWELGADGIETDVRLTADGRIVSIHDQDTSRVAGIKRLVEDSRYEELQALDVGSWKGQRWCGEKMPLLEESLAIVPEGKKILVELKTGPEIVGPLAEVLEAAPLAADQILIMGFDADAISACKKQMPQFKCHLLASYKQRDGRNWTPGVDDVIASVRRTQADGLGTEARPEHVNADFVRRLAAAGIGEFHVWTVDEPAVARFYQDLGAWAITTNRPELLRAALATR